MKLNIAYPANGSQKQIEIEEEQKLRLFYDKRISHEVEGDELGDEFKGYIFRIAGGNDKQGFPMMQGVLTNLRVRLLLRKGMPCYRPRRSGERKKKSVRGCIVSSEIAVLNLIIVKKGDGEIEGLTDVQRPRRLGPKRATKIRKLFNLSKDDDVRQYVIRRSINRDGKKPTTKAAKIQRLVTPARLQRKRRWKAIKKARYLKSNEMAKSYNNLINQRIRQQKEIRARAHQARRSESRKMSAKK